MLRKLLLNQRARPAAAVEDHGPGRSGALIQREDKTGHGRHLARRRRAGKRGETGSPAPVAFAKLASQLSIFPATPPAITAKSPAGRNHPFPGGTVPNRARTP